MSVENEQKQEQRRARGGSDGHSAGDEHHLTKAQVDEEIAALEARSRHQTHNIQAPPDIPPAPPRRALMVVGVALLILVVAGAITLIGRATHERALAKETEQETI